MKKILVFILCALLMCATPIVAFAEGDSANVGETEGVVEENSTTTEESATEGEISTPETVPEETPEETEPNWEDVKQTISDKIVNWILPHIEEISVIITLLLSIIYNIRRNKALDKSVAKLNNNAVSIAENSSTAINTALSGIEGVSGAVTGYQTEIALLLEQFRNTAEDKKKLEEKLETTDNYLKVATQANVEFANELAELLNLANIPNFKKEELGSRHVAYVNAIIEAAAKAEAKAAAMLPTSTEEVKKDVGEEA